MNPKDPLLDKGYKLVHVTCISRHGWRTPSSDTNLHVQNQFWETALSKNNAFWLYQHLIRLNRWKNVCPLLSNSNILLSSSTKQLCTLFFNLCSNLTAKTSENQCMRTARWQKTSVSDMFDASGRLHNAIDHQSTVRYGLNGEAGELTNFGFSQMNLIGVLLRKRYADYLNCCHREKTHRGFRAWVVWLLILCKSSWHYWFRRMQVIYNKKVCKIEDRESNMSRLPIDDQHVSKSCIYVRTTQSRRTVETAYALLLGLTQKRNMLTWLTRQSVSVRLLYWLMAKLIPYHWWTCWLHVKNFLFMQVDMVHPDCENMYPRHSNTKLKLHIDYIKQHDARYQQWKIRYDKLIQDYISYLHHIPTNDQIHTNASIVEKNIQCQRLLFYNLKTESPSDFYNTVITFVRHFALNHTTDEKFTDFINQLSMLAMEEHQILYQSSVNPAETPQCLTDYDINLSTQSSSTLDTSTNSTSLLYENMENRSSFDTYKHVDHWQDDKKNVNQCSPSTSIDMNDLKTANDGQIFKMSQRMIENSSTHSTNMSSSNVAPSIRNMSILMGGFVRQVCMDMEDYCLRDTQYKNQHNTNKPFIGAQKNSLSQDQNTHTASFSLYVGHEVTLMPFLFAFNLATKKHPVMGSLIVLELYRKQHPLLQNKHDYFVQVVYNPHYCSELLHRHNDITPTVMNDLYIQYSERLHNKISSDKKHTLCNNVYEAFSIPAYRTLMESIEPESDRVLLSWQTFCQHLQYTPRVP